MLSIYDPIFPVINFITSAIAKKIVNFIAILGNNGDTPKYDNINGST